MADRAQGRTGSSAAVGGGAGADDAVEQGKQKAREVKEQGKETAQELKAEGKQKARELKEKGKDAARDAKHRAEEQVDRRSTEAADHLDSVVRALQSAADTLDNDGESWLADYSRQAAGQVDRVTGYLRDRDSGSMVRDLERSARENPGTFLGTAMAAGVALGRFLRSSEPGPDHDRGGSQGEGGSMGDRPGYTRTGMAGAAGSPAGTTDLNVDRGGVSTGGSAMASRAAGGAATSRPSNRSATGEGGMS